jgi:hypothetical protein
MSSRALQSILVAILLMGASDTMAYLLPPVLVPAMPDSDDPVSFVVESGHCDALLGDFELIYEGSFIHAVVDGVRSAGICAYPPYTDTFEIGTFAVGAYTLQVDYRYHRAGLPDDLYVETIGVIDFNVSQAPAGVSARPVPGLGRFGIIGLGLLLIVAAGTLRGRVHRKASRSG